MTLHDFLKLILPYFVGALTLAWLYFMSRDRKPASFAALGFLLLLILISSLLGCSASPAPSSRAAPPCAGLGVPSFAVTMQGRAVGSCACIAGHWWFVDPLGTRTEGGADWCPLPRAQAELVDGNRSL